MSPAMFPLRLASFAVAFGFDASARIPLEVGDDVQG